MIGKLLFLCLLAAKSHNPLATVMWDVAGGYCLVGSWLKRQLPPIFNPPLKKVTPRTTVFAFDLHDVMFTFNFKKFTEVMLTSPYRWRILAQFINPLFTWDLFDFFVSHDPLEQYVRDVIEPKYPSLQPAISTIYAIANSVVPIAGTLEIIDQLHDQGYDVYLLSNIDQITFGHLKAQHPEIFRRFDGFYTRSEENGYLRKPHISMYQEFIEQFGLQRKQIVFVDDLLRNIHGAEQAGMYGIFFQGPEEFREQLIALGVL